MCRAPQRTARKARSGRFGLRIFSSLPTTTPSPILNCSSPRWLPSCIPSTCRLLKKPRPSRSSLRALPPSTPLLPTQKPWIVRKILRHRENLIPYHRLQCYHGYSFKPPRVTGTLHVKSGGSGDVDMNVQWCHVMEMKLGNTRLVIGGEVDCVRGASQNFLCCLWNVTSAELGSIKVS